MGKFCSVLVASVQYMISIYVFKTPDLSAGGPLVSSVVVLLSLFLVLWSLPLYPRRLRKLVWIANSLAEYIIAVFLIEYIMGCFWFPLEAAVLALLPKIAAVMEQYLLYVDLSCHVSCDLMKQEGSGMFMSYLLSFLILVAALHATRIINLKLLSGGISPFIFDLTCRFKKLIQNCSESVGLSRFNKKKPNKQDCYNSEDDGFDFDPDTDQCDPGQESGYHYVFR